MTTFTIDPDGKIRASRTAREVGRVAAGTELFHSEPELGQLTLKWPGGRLVKTWNSLPGVLPVKKFTDRQTAVARIWKAVENLAPVRGQRAGSVAPKRAVPSQKTTKVTEQVTREHTKAALVVALLGQTGGASLKAIMLATGWQAHSVRGFISGHLVKKLGLRVKSFKRDGERIYAIRK